MNDPISYSMKQKVNAFTIRIRSLQGDRTEKEVLETPEGRRYMSTNTYLCPSGGNEKVTQAVTYPEHVCLIVHSNKLRGNWNWGEEKLPPKTAMRIQWVKGWGISFQELFYVLLCLVWFWEMRFEQWLVDDFCFSFCVRSYSYLYAQGSLLAV